MLLLPQFQILTSAGLQGADATASDKTERCGHLHLDLCIATRCMTGGTPFSIRWIVMEPSERRIGKKMINEKLEAGTIQQPLNFFARHSFESRLASVTCAGVIRCATSSRLASACFCSSPFKWTAAMFTHIYART